MRTPVLVGICTSLLLVSCGGGSESTGDPDTTEDTEVDTVVEDTVEDVQNDTVVEDTVVEDTLVSDVVDDVPTVCTAGYFDDLGSNNQNITGVERVIFLGDSITATPYITPPWSDRIRDDLRDLFGDDLEIQNYAVGGARTDDVLDEQILDIDTTSTKKTLVMFTIGGNDAVQVMGEDIDTSLAHMESKMPNLRGTLEFLADPSNFPGGVYVVFGNIYDPTDEEGDFTHCGIAAFGDDWPDAAYLAEVVNGWYLDLAYEFCFDVLNMHDLWLGHGWNNTDTENPHYCNGCDPDCPCPRWLDFTCIHPNGDGHEALAGFFLDIVSR